MPDEHIDVLIVEDESTLAQLHAALVNDFPCLRVTGIASTLAQAREMIEQRNPQLVLMDNYLPDGQGISLISSAMFSRAKCAVIFITAASDMNICSQAIRVGAFDYILKPVSLKRLSQSLENFIRFSKQQREWKVVDQKNVDLLYQLQAKNFRQRETEKGIEENTLARVQQLFSEGDQCLSVDEVMVHSGLSKTTARRYLEYCVRTGLLGVEMVYGKIGHPRRLYRRRLLPAESPSSGQPDKGT
ncbi:MULTISPECIES: response regulator [Tatumella]|uniref:Transcriptional regulatory protein n=1 Tax=Tatumella punctata TaxID=399969 RepID=A0ABW1VMW3_9GAMM|nr:MULTISPECIES: response regulator [unclassified Tatumella]MBS0877038.1 response regulator [Tatumella sp. JGM82]MBS0890694.1 response regulator [Tatumella sp. JGM94]MBS0893365.1 response regulator [Tatumella sp. JGM130]MBS0901341.1 response regulator [Tatumella sp. JGM100]